MTVVLDLVVANGKDDTVSILLGNGDGTFTAGAPVPVGGISLFYGGGGLQRRRLGRCSGDQRRR